MRAGRLDKRITIQQKSLTRDAFGAAIPSWTTFATVWAEVKSEGQSGSIVDSADAEQVKSTRVFKIRAGITVTTEMRILYQGNPWRILNQPNEIAREGYEILAERYTDDN